MHTAALVSLATSVPPHTFSQKDVLAAAWDIFGSRFPNFERFASIFTNTGIVKRHGVKPFEWYLEPRGWPERTAAFLEGAEVLFAEVAEKALANAGLGLDPRLFGTHSLRRTKATLIYRRTGNLRAVQLLLGHTKIESTVRYLGIEVDDALAIAEQVDV
jgi:hypothetical protein